MIFFLVCSLVVNSALLYVITGAVIHYSKNPILLIVLWLSNWMVGNVILYFITQQMYKHTPDRTPERTPNRAFTYRKLLEEAYSGDPQEEAESEDLYSAN